MAFSQSQLDALEAAIAEGTLMVKYADKSVTYRSLAEMLRLRDVIIADLAAQAGMTSDGVMYATTSKGLR